MDNNKMKFMKKKRSHGFQNVIEFMRKKENWKNGKNKYYGRLIIIVYFLLKN